MFVTKERESLTDRPAIEVNQLGKEYRHGWFGKRVNALQDVSFQVFPGQVFGLLGPNGAGKTTLIKILLGIVRSTAGSARLLNYAAGDRRGRRRVGYLPEHLRLARHQTARTALEFYGRLNGLSRRQILAKRDDLLTMVGLDGRDRESVRRFSKGMQQRLGLAQALLHDPDVLILDEPTDGLDPVGRQQIRQLLHHLRDQGRTVFLNSHLLQEVELICDQVAILDHGRLKFVGTIGELTPTAETDLRMHVSGDEKVIHEVTSGYPNATVVPLSGGLQSIHLSVPDQVTADLLVDRLRQRNVSIVQLNRNKKTLESAFLELIAEKAEVV
ncbi:MAG: ABC transporter ATP-binding protein [Planctomycetaceae bacterium]|nr:ABC transporter ATP-binding protein [Planctomycetaceae bacterium]